MLLPHRIGIFVRLWLGIKFVLFASSLFLSWRHRRRVDFLRFQKSSRRKSWIRNVPATFSVFTPPCTCTWLFSMAAPPQILCSDVAIDKGDFVYFGWHVLYLKWSFCPCGSHVISRFVIYRVRLIFGRYTSTLIRFTNMCAWPSAHSLGKGSGFLSVGYNFILKCTTYVRSCYLPTHLGGSICKRFFDEIINIKLHSANSTCK